MEARWDERALALRLYEKATEKQDAQDNNNRDYDNLDQTHGEILNVSRAKNDKPNCFNEPYSKSAQLLVSNKLGARQPLSE